MERCAKLDVFCNQQAKIQTSISNDEDIEKQKIIIFALLEPTVVWVQLVNQ